jgi:hypothetical protein
MVYFISIWFYLKTFSLSIHLKSIGTKCRWISDQGNSPFAAGSFNDSPVPISSFLHAFNHERRAGSGFVLIRPLAAADVS